MRISQNLIKYFALLGLIVFVAALFIGGEQPGAGDIFPPPWDKLAHIVAYGTIGLLVGLSLPKRAWPWIVLIVVIIGGLDEIHQIYLPGRHAGFDDWAADWVGAFFCLPIITKFRKHIPDD